MGRPTLIVTALFLLAPIRTEAAPPAVNIDVLRTLAAEAAEEVCLRIALRPGEGFLVEVLPPELAWVVDEAVRGAFVPAALPDVTQTVRTVCAVKEASVTYDAYDREGLFGRKTAERLVTLTLTVTITRDGSREPLFSGDVRRVRTDRIPVADIPRLDHPTLSIARGTPAGEGFFADIAEPLILLGAIGVTVFLLFHVRS